MIWLSYQEVEGMVFRQCFQASDAVWDCVSTLVIIIVKLLDIFKEPSEHFPTMFVKTKLIFPIET